jgi:predicted Zn-dependent peptidase
MTCFYAHCLPEHVMTAEDVLSDIMRPAIRQQDFDDEKTVILEEIAMYADQPFWVLFERALEEYYGEHPLSNRVLGTRDSIVALKRDQMEAYFAQRYSADNTTVAMAGRIDFDAIVARLREHCGDWRRTRTRRAYDQPQYQTRRFTQTDAKISNTYLLMLSPAPAMQDERRYAASMLAHILGDPKGSRLYWALIEPGLAEEVVAQYDGHDGVGTWFVYAACSPESADEVEGIINREVQSLVNSVTEDDLERVRSKVLSAVTLHSELPAGRMMRLGRQWTYQGAYTPLEEELRRMDAVTLADVRSVYEAYPMTARVVGRLTPGE